MFLRIFIFQFLAPAVVSYAVRPYTNSFPLLITNHDLKYVNMYQFIILTNLISRRDSLPVTFYRKVHLSSIILNVITLITWAMPWHQKGVSHYHAHLGLSEIRSLVQSNG